MYFVYILRSKNWIFHKSWVDGDQTDLGVALLQVGAPVGLTVDAHTALDAPQLARLPPVQPQTLRWNSILYFSSH
jgi:hypothetical protein